MSRHKPIRAALFTWVLTVATLSLARDGWSAPSRDQIAFFEQRIRPVLVDKCYRCHSTKANKAQGGLRLDSRKALRRGGNGGPPIVAGKPDQSLLL